MGLRSFGAQLKALVRKELTFYPATPGGIGSFVFGLSGGHYNYAAAVGDGLLSSVVMPCVQFMMRAFPEAPLVVRTRQADELEIVDNHPMVQLVDRPNDFYPGTLLWMATILDWVLFGESYWRILRDQGGRPGELWWVPPWSISPKWPQDGSVFISHYDYHPDGRTTIRLELDEVLHFRHGIDPHNPRHGLPPLRAIMQDIWVDAESNNFVGSMLRNMGVPGMIISPKGEERLSPADVEQIKVYISSRFTGDHRGEPLAMGGSTDVQKLSCSPAELEMSGLRNTAEERVSAALGIPSAVIGFKSGLDSTKVGATMHEYVRLAWNNGLIPLQRLMATELQRVLLPQFDLNPDGLLVGWDYDEVQALQEDQNALAERYEGLVTSGILKVSEARQALGYDSDENDQIYLRPNNLTPIDPKDQMPTPEPVVVQAPPPNSNGTGSANSNGNGNGSRNGAVATRDFKQSLDEWVIESIGRHAQRLTNPSAALKRLAARLMREEKRLQPKFQQMILTVLRNYGERAATATRELFPQKSSPEDMIRMAIVHERIPLASIQFEMAQIYEEIGSQMADLIIAIYKEVLDLPLTTDTRLRALVQQAAADRVRLLDLSGEAKDAILRSLDEGRQAGLSEDAMVEMIRDRVPAGRWTSSEVRAQVIARSESRYLGNIAAARYAEESGVGKVLILDALLGPTDETCQLVNGWVVSPSEARALSGSEHPNGTRMILSLPAATQAGGVTI